MTEYDTQLQNRLNAKYEDLTEKIIDVDDWNRLSLDDFDKVLFDDMNKVIDDKLLSHIEDVKPSSAWMITYSTWEFSYQGDKIETCNSTW